MTVPVLATNVRKARFESTCPLCGGPMRVGQQIARCPGRVWFHASCYIRTGHKHYIDRPDMCATEGEQP